MRVTSGFARRFLGAAVVTAALAVLTPLVIAFACTAMAQLSLSPSTASEGDTIAVTGTGFQDASKDVGNVIVRWNGSSGPILWQGAPPANGALPPFSFVVPQGSPQYSYVRGYVYDTTGKLMTNVAPTSQVTVNQPAPAPQPPAPQPAPPVQNPAAPAPAAPAPAAQAPVAAQAPDAAQGPPPAAAAEPAAPAPADAGSNAGNSRAGSGSDRQPPKAPGRSADVRTPSTSALPLGLLIAVIVVGTGLLAAGTAAGIRALGAHGAASAGRRGK